MRLILPVIGVCVYLALGATAIADDNTAPDSFSTLNPGLPPDAVPPSDDGPHDSAKFYLSGARARKEQGRAFVEFTVQKDGSVAEPSLTKSTGYTDLDEAAIQAVESWRYKPATAGGKPIEARWKAYVDFQCGFTPPRTDGAPHSADMFYPESARHQHEEGPVEVRFTITTDGTVADPSVSATSGFADLDDAALQAVKTWRYKPAMQDGKLIAVRTQAKVLFHLIEPPPTECKSLLCKLLHSQ